ncbi:MAG: peptidase M29 [Proteobacteria bacterium]|nr:peptidase M29 [Pseudomonadota bacterium]
MLRDRIEAAWIDAFERVFALSEVRQGDAVAILSESQSRQINVHLAELALLRLGAKPFHIVLPTPPQVAPVPIRSTGAAQVIGGLKPVVTALAASTMVVDITVEGMMHAPETRAILKGGSRILYISNEHPEALERLAPNEALKPKVERGIAKLKAAKTMNVTSPRGTDLRIGLDGAPCGGGWGYCAEPGRLDHWPGGLCLAFPGRGAVQGRLVLDRGDLNLTFKRYIETPVTLVIEDDFAVAVEGDGLDAELMRSYFEAWDDKNAYAVSHVGWGMNPAARWDALMMYDKGDINGTEQRAFAGNFLYSTGANEFANRFTLGHFDLPMRNCSVELDGEAVVVDGKLQGSLA